MTRSSVTADDLLTGYIEDLRRRGKHLRLFLLDSLRLGLAAFALSAPAAAGSISSDVPSAIDTDARYLFYMHGIAIERGGQRARAYDYSGILEALSTRGFVVIGEARGPVGSGAYAKKLAGQVRTLLAAGVPARNLTVAGHSKGGMITMLVMTLLANPDIAYVNFAACGREGSGFEGHLRFAEEGAALARGRLLSAYDKSDQIAGSCKVVLDRMSQAVVTERVLDIGGGHELFYQPRTEWLDMLQAWAERQQP